MQRFGALPSSTTLAIQVTFDPTTVMIRRGLVMSCSLQKNRLLTVPYFVRNCS